MARLVDHIITDTRNHTENQDFNDTIGIPDSEFLRFLNDAQYRIHNLITQQHPQVFIEEKEYNIVANQESYSLPSVSLLGNKISNVEYSHSGNNDDYTPLRKVALKLRWSGSNGHPSSYIQKSGKILLNPVPNNSVGKLRVNYVKAIPKLDKRRASVDSVTLDTSNLTITTLMLNVSTDTIDSTELDKHTRFCVVDAEGNIKMKNVRFDAINTTTGEVTINSSFVYESGESITAGDYITAGSFSTTHSILDDMVERYIIAYCAAKIFHRDSSADLGAQMSELSSIESDIVAAYAEISDDIMEIPEIISEDDSWDW